MKTIRIILGAISIIIIILGFLSWRLEFSLPYYDFWYYIIAGAVLGYAVYSGRVIAPYLMFLSLFPFAYSGFLLLFVKSTTWNDISLAIIIGIVLLAAGFILYMIGSESVKLRADAQLSHDSRDVVCAACDQYLGKAGGFKSPCPRCGSNRYSLE